MPASRTALFAAVEHVLRAIRLEPRPPRVAVGVPHVPGGMSMRVRAVLDASMLFTALAGQARAQTILQNSTFEATLVPWAATASSAPDPVATGSALWTNTKNLDNVLNGSGSSDTTLAGAAAQPANAAFGIR